MVSTTNNNNKNNSDDHNNNAIDVTFGCDSDDVVVTANDGVSDEGDISYDGGNSNVDDIGME